MHHNYSRVNVTFGAIKLQVYLQRHENSSLRRLPVSPAPPAGKCISSSVSAPPFLMQGICQRGLCVEIIHVLGIHLRISQMVLW